MIELVVPEESRFEIDKLIEENRAWLEDKHSEALDYRNKIPERDFRPGGEINVLGEEKEIVIEKRRGREVNEDIIIPEHLASSSLEIQIEKALKEYARKIFSSKASQYAGELGVNFNDLYVRDQSTRWGSCSSRDNLNFNWRLVLGPEKVLDYVVAHEVAHLKHGDHSDSFWNTVEDLYPEYREAEAWLNENSARLEWKK